MQIQKQDSLSKTSQLEVWIPQPDAVFAHLMELTAADKIYRSCQFRWRDSEIEPEMPGLLLQLLSEVKDVSQIAKNGVVATNHLKTHIC